MFCPHCGHAAPDSARFCQKCGKPLAVSPPAVQHPPLAWNLPVGMDMVNGAIHWRYTLNLWKDRRTLTIIELVYLVTLAFFGIILFFTNLRWGLEDALKMLLFVFVVPFAVLTVITIISWLILIAIKGGKLQMEFYMNESQVMYCDSLQTFPSEYRNVKRIVTHRKINMIGVNGVVQKNTIYTSNEQYEFVLNYIRTRCPNADFVEK